MIDNDTHSCAHKLLATVHQLAKSFFHMNHIILMVEMLVNLLKKEQKYVYGNII